MSAYLVVANFPNGGEQIWYGIVSESISELKAMWDEHIAGCFYPTQDDLPTPLRILYVKVDGTTEILSWDMVDRM